MIGYLDLERCILIFLDFYNLKCAQRNKNKANRKTTTRAIKINIFLAAILNYLIYSPKPLNKFYFDTCPAIQYHYYTFRIKIKTNFDYQKVCILNKKNYGGHLGFSIFDQEPLERRFGSWHIWNQHTQKPLYANFHALLTKCTPISHICPTIRYMRLCCHLVTSRSFIAIYMLSCSQTS